MSYMGRKLKDTISIDVLYDVHRYELAKNHRLNSEMHNFWEMVYVDKGKITTVSHDSECIVEQGDVIFYKPNKQHTLRVDDASSADIISISFDCTSNAMVYFEDKILHLNQNQKRIVAQIVKEYTAAFFTPSDTPEETLFIGAEQLLKQYICEFLISLLRSSSLDTSIKRNGSSYLLELLVSYMELNINSTIHIDDLIKYSGSNKTTITNIFKQAFNMGAIEYFINLKINQAKELLQDDTYNITQIAEFLGYSGIHYFSRQFKKVTGMSPTEYLHSINR